MVGERDAGAGPHGRHTLPQALEETSRSLERFQGNRSNSDCSTMASPSFGRATGLPCGSVVVTVISTSSPGRTAPLALAPGRDGAARRFVTSFTFSARWTLNGLLASWNRTIGRWVSAATIPGIAAPGRCASRPGECAEDFPESPTFPFSDSASVHHGHREIEVGRQASGGHWAPSTHSRPSSARPVDSPAFASALEGRPTPTPADSPPMHA